MPDLFDNTPNAPRNALLTRACVCGSHHFKVEQGTGPHAAGIRCAVCGQHAGWLSKVEFEEWRATL